MGNEPGSGAVVDREGMLNVYIICGFMNMREYLCVGFGAQLCGSGVCIT